MGPERSLRIKSCMFVWLLPALLPGQLLAETGASDDDWELVAEAYLWAPNVDIETASGENQEVKFSELADMMVGGAMGGLYAERNRWLLGVDFMFFDLDDKDNTPLGPGVELSKVGLKVFYANPVVGYQIVDSARSRLHVYTGVRYLWAEYALTIRESDPNPPGRLQDSQSDDRFDAIVGLHGTTDLNDRWYVAYQADIGTGQSDTVGQLVLDMNYRFKRFDAALGYRYLRWDPDSDLFSELEFNGFFAGAKFFF